MRSERSSEIQSGATVKKASSSSRSPGYRDTTFGDGGIVDTPIPGSGAGVYGAALTGDGHIVAAGAAERKGDGGTTSDGVIARYSAGGALDGTFGDGGLAFVNFNPPERVIFGQVAVLPDGHVLALGAARSSPSSSEYLIAKFNPNGSLDATFGAGGIVRHSNVLYAMALQPDGKIVAAGSSFQAGRTDLSAIRLHANGSLEPSFGAAGSVVLVLTPESRAYAVTVDGTGRIVLGGGISAPAPAKEDFALLRLMSTGALDATFASGGIVSTNLGADDWILGLHIQPDGKYLTAGVSIKSGPTAVSDALARFLSDGTPARIRHRRKGRRAES